LAQKRLADVVAELLFRGVKPFVLGGGHEVAWANHQGIIKAFPNSPIAVINWRCSF